LNQLKQLGDVNQARYQFLSQSFMERHFLGPYGRIADVESDARQDVLLQENLLVSRDEDGVESDSEWIVEALTQESEGVESPGLHLEPDIGLSLGSDGPKVSVGVGFSIGENTRKRSKKRASSISSVARQSGISVKAKKSTGPRVSDRDGGVMGRLRAAGANSLVGRNILGAYPGDLPPPQEAADANGLIDLAERYGYGDWSDDEDSSDEMEFLDDDEKVESRSRNASSRSTKKKKRRRKPRQDLALGLDFDLSPPSQHSPSSLTPRKSSSSRGTRSNSSKSKSTTSLTTKRKGQRPSKAMEKLKEFQPEKLNPPSSSTASLQEDISSKHTSRPRRVRPATSLLESAKSEARETGKDKDEGN